jgi:hypothetical protein
VRRRRPEGSSIGRPSRRVDLSRIDSQFSRLNRGLSWINSWFSQLNRGLSRINWRFSRLNRAPGERRHCLLHRAGHRARRGRTRDRSGRANRSHDVASGGGLGGPDGGGDLRRLPARAMEEPGQHLHPVLGSQDLREVDDARDAEAGDPIAQPLIVLMPQGGITMQVKAREMMPSL